MEENLVNFLTQVILEWNNSRKMLLILKLFDVDCTAFDDMKS